MSKLLEDIKHHESYSKKKEHDWQWCKNAFDIYDQNLSITRDDKRRMEIKYSLAQGDMPRLNPYDMGIMNIRMNPAQRKRDFNLIPNVPIIDTLYNLIIGERQRQVFEPMAFDIGLFSRGEKSRLHLLYLQKYLEKTIYEPYKAEITQQYMMEMGVQSPTQLGHEEQQQMLSDVNKRLLEMTPDKINEYFKKDYVSPFSEEAQMLLNYEGRTKNLKHHFEERFKHGYLSNVEASYIYESHGNPYIDLCNPEGLSWDCSDDVNFLEDCDIVKYETYRTYMDIFNRYGDKIKASDVDKIDAAYYNKDRYGNNWYNGGTTYRSTLSPMAESEIISFYSSDDGKKMFPNGIDQNTKEGQQALIALQAKFYQGGGLVGERIRDCHIVFRTPVLMKHVKRMVNGREEYSWRDYDYKLNPDHGDIDEKVIRSTEVWGQRMIGNQGRGIYVDSGPTKYQWADIDNPRKRKLPYSGPIYSKLMGNAKNRGGFDRGVPYQIQFNIESARLEEEKSFNIGKLFTMFMSAKPDEYSWEAYVDLIRGTRIVPIDETKLMGNSAAIAMASAGHVFKSVDLTNSPSIVEGLQQLDIIYKNMMRAMSIDPGRYGDASPYISIENNKQNIQNSSNKTLDIYTTHNHGINNTLQMYMEFCHYVYSKNPRVLTWVADDMSMAELRLSDPFLSFGKVGTFYTNSIDDQRDLQDFKMQLMNFIQNPDAFRIIEELARISFAKSPTELLNAAHSISMKYVQQVKEAQEGQQAALEQEYAAEQQNRQQEHQYDVELQREKQSGNIEVAAISAEQFMNQYDIDQDSINDSNEREDKKLRHETEENEKDRKLELQIESMRLAAAKAKKPNVLHKKSKKK